MTIKLFVKEDCPRCPAAKKACEGIPGVEVYDVSDVEGLAEASFHGILATPSVLVLDGDGHEVVAWRGAVPDRSLLARLATVH